MLWLPQPMLFSEPSEFFFTAGYDSPLGHLDLAMSEHGLAVVALHGHWSAPHGSHCPDPAGNVRWIEEPERSATSAASWMNILPATAANSICRSTCAGPNFTGAAGRRCCVFPTDKPGLMRSWPPPWVRRRHRGPWARPTTTIR